MYYYGRCLVGAHRLHNAGGKYEKPVRDVLVKWRTKFAQSGVSEPQESIEHILAHVLGTKKTHDVYRYRGKTLLPKDMEKIDDLCEKRLRRMPVQYIIQEWDFRDLTLKMSRPVFIPRPETEMLVDIVLDEIECRGVDKVLELCCGSGAIGLALLKSKPGLKVTAIDKFSKACELAKENAEINGLADRLTVIQTEINENFSLSLENFDVIVSNPPYIPSGDMRNLQPEISMYEDLGALDGGNDGLLVIIPILRVCSRLLNYEGKLYLEVDTSHPKLIGSFCEQNSSLGLRVVRSCMDYGGKERFLELIKIK